MRKLKLTLASNERRYVLSAGCFAGVVADLVGSAPDFLYYALDVGLAVSLASLGASLREVHMYAAPIKQFMRTAHAAGCATTLLAEGYAVMTHAEGEPASVVYAAATHPWYVYLSPSVVSPDACVVFVACFVSRRAHCGTRKGSSGSWDFLLYLSLDLELRKDFATESLMHSHSR